MTSFQEKCLRQVEDLFSRDQRAQPGFQLISGEAESYLRTSLDFCHKALEIYIYEDEAGFFEDGQWTICEQQDFSTDDELIACFLERLSQTLPSAGSEEVPPE